MALNLDDLWIGDPVLIRSTNEQGVYSGKSKTGKAIIKIEDEIKEIDAKNLTEAKEEIEKPKEKNIEIDVIEKLDIKSVSNFKPEIDLHLEKLAPGKSANDFINVIDFQLSKCRYFIQQAIEYNASRIVIIHGKGQGKLKQAVDFLLLEFDEVNLKNSTNNGGAIEVWFKR